MKQQDRVPPSEPYESSTQDSRQVFDLLRYTLDHTIDERANAAVRERNKSFIAWLLGILTVLAVVVTAGAGFTLKLYVEATANEAVAESFEDVRFETEVAALNFRLLSLDDAIGFTTEEAEAIIREIGSLVARGGEQGLSKLEFAFDTAVANFASAKRLDLVLRLKEKAPSLFQNSDVVVQTMLQAQGFALLADAGAPNSWMETTGSLRETYNSYREYADRARISGFPELYLLYEMLLRHVEDQDGSEEKVKKLIDDSDSLNEADAEQFIKVMVALATEQTVIDSTAESKRVAAHVADFLCKYEDAGTHVANVVAFSRTSLPC